MYILLFAVSILAIAFAIRSFLYWTFPELPEDSSRFEEQPASPSIFYDPRTWVIFKPMTLISYRRDKKGRFRKMP